MLKDFAWKAFESTGNIDAYVFLKEIEAQKQVIKEKNCTDEEINTNQ